MPLEIEVKLKVAGHEGVRGRLLEAGAVRKGGVLETNIFFDWADGELRRRDSGLRVRVSRGEDGKEGTLLTFKGPATAEGMRSREAFDVHVVPGEQMAPMLLAMGFKRVMMFEKQRESWELEGCLVELDTMPVFGTFVEVEGPGEEGVSAVQEKIGLGGVAAESARYSKMVGEYLREREERELRF